MTSDRRNFIIRKRLNNWMKILERGNATPALLLGIGHGPRSGDVQVCVTEDMSTEDLLVLLKGVVVKMERGEFEL